MKCIVSSVLALAVAASAGASPTISASNEKSASTIEKTVNGVKQAASAANVSVARVGANTNEGPYTKAMVTISRTVNGVERVLGSKVVSVTESVAQYSDSVEYVGQCTKEGNKEPECTTQSTPVGMLAHVQYVGTPKGGAPVYHVSLGWRELVSLNNVGSDGAVIQIPEVSSHEVTLSSVSYKKPMEYTSLSQGDGVNENTIMRVKLM